MLALAAAECKSVPAVGAPGRPAYDDGPGTTGEPAEMFPMGRRRRYIVFFPGRAGGSFLASNLAEHPEVLITPEPLGVRKIHLGAEGQARWVRRYYGRPLRRERAIGISTKLTDICEPDWFADYLRAQRMRVVLLSRDNDVKRTISIIRARALNAETGRWNRRSGVKTVDPTVVDPEEFATKLANNRTRKEALIAYATSLDLPMLRIDYRDLMVDPPGTLARVFEHIGVEPRPVAGSTLKNTSDDLRESVSNFDELRGRYAGTEYEAMFDEVLHT
jgi:hypothetical protein